MRLFNDKQMKNNTSLSWLAQTQNIRIQGVKAMSLINFCFDAEILITKTDSCYVWAAQWWRYA